MGELDAVVHGYGIAGSAPRRRTRRGTGRLCSGPRRQVIARAGNRILAEHDPTAHAELVAIRHAAHLLGSERLEDCDLYVTLEPCAMCAGAVSFARIRRLYYGAADPKSGAVDNGVRIYASPSCHHRPEVYGGLAEAAAGDLLKKFFKERR